MPIPVKQGFQKPRPLPLNPGSDGWETAVLLTERWLARQDRVDALLEQLTPGLPPQERARAQHLFYGAVRWAGRIESALAGLMSRPPRTKVRAVLFVAGFELLSPDTEAAKVVHYVVGRAKTVTSLKEAGLINAVARKLASRLAETPTSLADAHAHPEWLVARWERQFGADATRQLLEWNQQPAPVYARWRNPATPVPDFLTASRWPGFYELKAGNWEAVRALAQSGDLYLQDPSTRLALELLAPRRAEIMLDACAAPGGKSLMIADALSAAAPTDTTGARLGHVVALDEPSARLDRLKENLNRVPTNVTVSLMPADLRSVSARDFESCNLPANYDAVLLDAPCSNTGVMRHRIDVKWRLQEGDFAKHATQQVDLLKAAARLVREGGRLVYSTCSIEPVENGDVVQRFLKQARGWRLDRHVVALPWIDGHDGAGAFLLRRQ
ncbi:MAG: RsmB/NOP family class I SAM-dependent RNA methyltransferase [Candidatus Didemnitutus sp.]|nr:RsmB/NOP family class I SAM-dependent RNA methyltransferase [Candidatus Didemnitutus sp.]